MRGTAARLLVGSSLACAVVGAGCSTSSTEPAPAPAPETGTPPPGSTSKKPRTDPPAPPDDDPPTGACSGKQDGLYALSAKKLASAEMIPLCRYAESVLLIVNVASSCGYTPHYGGLQKLYDSYKDKGFYVLAFPSQSFNQEYSDETQISTFCTNEYKITFPMFAIGDVKGGAKQPVYQWLNAQPGMETEVAWNFEKFLVGRDGKIAARFAHTVEPDPAKDPTIEAAIKTELEKP